MTHPVTTSRIAEARDRARNYDPVRNEDSISYGIASIRVIIDRFETPQQAVAYFENRAYQNQNEYERYGRMLAYMRNGSYSMALDIAEGLTNRIPGHCLSYRFG